MRAGQLRHKINILKPIIGQTSYGDEKIVWSTDLTVWAAIWPLRGKEYYDAQSVGSVISHKVRMRYTTLSNSTKIDSKCRIEMTDGSSRKFEIVSPPMDPDMRNIYLDLMCKESS